jgi:hypothetical protein
LGTFLSNQTVKQTFAALLKKSKKGTTTQTAQITKEKSLIYPHTDSYLQGSDYFFLKCKRENYKDLALKGTLERLGVKTESLKEVEKVRKSSTASIETNETRTHSIESERKSVVSSLTNKDIIKLNKFNNPSDNVTEMIRGIDLKQVKDFIPKNFRIIKK